MGQACVLGIVLAFVITLVNAQCASFQFPTVSSRGTLLGTEHAQVIIPFVLDVTNCSDTGPFTITVSKMDAERGIYVDLCKLHWISRKAQSFRKVTCEAGPENGHYTLMKTVDRSDQVLWRWKTSERGLASEKVMEFHVIVQTSNDVIVPVIIVITIAVFIIVFTILLIRYKEKICSHCRQSQSQDVYCYAVSGNSRQNTTESHIYSDILEAVQEFPLDDKSDYLHPVLCPPEQPANL